MCTGTCTGHFNSQKIFGMPSTSPRLQLKATKQLKDSKQQLESARRSKEAGRFDRDLSFLELKLAKCQMEVDEVGDPPLKLVKAADRVKQNPNVTHRLGQGGIPSLNAAFVSSPF
jgi:hypothetical protein